ncbi:MAG: transporter [Lentisphaerae bacterium]|nr:transporter [Lentisphaerota bacterium]
MRTLPQAGPDGRLPVPPEERILVRQPVRTMRTNNTIRRIARRLAGITCLLAGILAPTDALAQGCVIARGGGCGAMVMHGDGFPEPGEWQLSLAYRYFHSDRHFSGDEEQTQRQAEGTQVDNWSNFLDTIIAYNATQRFSVNFTMPFVWHERSSLYEHDGINRHSTYAYGLADVRLGLQYWLLKPETHHRGNIAVGLGGKAPTGDYRATDISYSTNGPTLSYVDSSIQPGDGGWGFYASTEGFLAIAGNLSSYMQGFYLFNPRELVPETGYSVPDSYMGRMGLNYVVWPSQRLALSFGGRVEGVPSEDVIGGSRGTRRPGYSVGLEPGISWTKGRWHAGLTVPIAVYRNRTLTYGRISRGDAAFADYSINFSGSMRF